MSPLFIPFIYFLIVVVMKLFQLIGLALVLRLYLAHRTQLLSVCVANRLISYTINQSRYYSCKFPVHSYRVLQQLLSLLEKLTTKVNFQGQLHRTRH